MRVAVNKKTVVADINGAGTSGRVDIIGRAVACAVVRYWPAAHDEHVAVPGRHGKRELAREQRKRERKKFTSKAKKEPATVLAVCYLLPLPPLPRQLLRERANGLRLAPEDETAEVFPLPPLDSCLATVLAVCN